MLGEGTTEEFYANEFKTLDLKDKRLNIRASYIGVSLQKRLTSCMKRLFINAKDMRQAYDFFFQSQSVRSCLVKTPLQ
jgi:hypothetical protein